MHVNGSDCELRNWRLLSLLVVHETERTKDIFTFLFAFVLTSSMVAESLPFEYVFAVI